jgi:hypothetical protein
VATRPAGCNAPYSGLLWCPTLILSRRVGARRRARLNAGSVSGRPSPNPACAFRYAPGSP